MTARLGSEYRYFGKLVLVPFRYFSIDTYRNIDIFDNTNILVTFLYQCRLATDYLKSSECKSLLSENPSIVVCKYRFCLSLYLSDARRGFVPIMMSIISKYISSRVMYLLIIQRVCQPIILFITRKY